MKYASILMTSLLCTGVATAATNATAHVRLSPEARAKQLMEKVGGLLILPRQGEVSLLNAQRRLPSEGIVKRCKFLSRALNANFVVRPCPGFALSTAEKAMQDAKANVAIFLIDDPTLPMSLVAIEGPWAFINMDKLADGKPDEDKLQTRFNAEINRIIDSLLGIGGQSGGSRLGPKQNNPGVVQKSPRKGSDLDGISAIGFSMDTALAINGTLAGWGILPERKSTYKRAVQQGWAPPPTNEYQKAIWEKVKNGQADATDPTNRWKRDFPEKK